MAQVVHWTTRSAIVRCEQATERMCRCTSCFGTLHGRDHTEVVRSVTRDLWVVDMRRVERMIRNG